MYVSLSRDRPGRWERLPESAQEGLEVARLFGLVQTIDAFRPDPPVGRSAATVCLGLAASRRLALSRDLRRFENLLFGVHGSANPTNPWFSVLLLTDEAAEPGRRTPSPLTMADIFALDLDARTVVLAACRTALGRLRPGRASWVPARLPARRVRLSGLEPLGDPQCRNRPSERGFALSDR